MIHEGNFKGSIDSVVVFGVIHLIMAFWLLLPVFNDAQVFGQVLSTGVSLSVILIGFVYYRFFTKKESKHYLIWRVSSYALLLLSGLQFMFYAYYQSANNPMIFYITLGSLVGVFILLLALRLSSEYANLKAALEDGRFDHRGNMDFSVLYRPVPLPIPGYIAWRLKKQRQYNTGSSPAGLIALALAVFTPFMESVVGAYIVGSFMVLISLAYTIMLLHSLFDLLFFTQLRLRF